MAGKRPARKKPSARKTSGRQAAGKKTPKRKRPPAKKGKKDPRAIFPFGIKKPSRARGAPRGIVVPWRPPTPNGHFDRLFFSICGHTHNLVRIDGYVQDLNSPNQHPFFHGSNGPMSISEILVPQLQTQFIYLIATLDFGGQVEHREYYADIVVASGDPNELIECATFGVAIHDLNGAPSVRPYCALFGKNGSCHGLPNSKMFP